MHLQSFFELLFGFFRNLINTLNTVTVDGFGVSVPLPVLIFACISLVMIANVFWRGAKG